MRNTHHQSVSLWAPLLMLMLAALCSHALHAPADTPAPIHAGSVDEHDEIVEEVQELDEPLPNKLGDVKPEPSAAKDSRDIEDADAPATTPPVQESAAPPATEKSEK